jgi:catechol 2,3-dioxygenase-like lactoylglutathione lyase family enzyme
MFSMRRYLYPLVLLAVAVLVLSLGGCAAHTEFGPPRASLPGAVTGMHHLLLTVADLSGSVHFYRDVLGMRVEHSMAHFAMLQAGNIGVALSTNPWDFEKKGESKGVGMIPHFTTPNMDEFAARLKQNGVPWLRAPVRESFGIEAFILDPDGYQWAILAPLEP